MIVVPRRNKIAGAVLVLLVGMAIVPLNGCGSRGGGEASSGGSDGVGVDGGNVSRSLSLTVALIP